MRNCNRVADSVRSLAWRQVEPEPPGLPQADHPPQRGYASRSLALSARCSSVHEVGNKPLTMLSNMLTDLNVSGV
jgi:hypothetical protein